MNAKQENYYVEKLNEYEFIECKLPQLNFFYPLSRNGADRIRDEDRSLPLLRRFLTNKYCPVTKLTIDRSTILKRGILEILKENKTITELNITYCTISPVEKHLLNEIADFLKGNRTITKLGLHLFMTYYGANKKNPEPRKVLHSLIGTSVSHLDFRENFLNSEILEDLKEVIPKLKLQTLNLQKNLKEKITKELDKSVIYIVRKNIFLEKLLVENISFDTRKKLEMNLEENKFIRIFFRIFLENYGPKRLGLMDAQKKQSIRDPKRLRLDLDVRRIINEYIPRNIEEGVDNFISYLIHIEKCLDGVRGYDINDFISNKSQITTLMENKQIIDPIIKKLTRYADYNQYTVRRKKQAFTTLTLGNKQTRGRKRKPTQMD